MGRPPIPVWQGVVDGDGKLRLESRALFQSHLHRLRNQPIELVIRKQGRPKSRSQLGYLYAAVYPVIAEELGYRDYEIDALHDAIMRHLRGLKPEPNPLKMRVSLREMDHEQVSAYIEDVRHWAVTEYGIVTPDADKAEAA